VGRFVNGFIADKLSDIALIRTGTAISVFGLLLVLIPTTATAVVGLLLVGLGFAPIYPCIIHSTPANFGEKNSQAIIGIQMASAYVGSTFMPPLFGVIAQHINIGLYPIYLAFFAVSLLIMTEWLNKCTAQNK
jgi:fucose permease